MAIFSLSLSLTHTHTRHMYPYTRTHPIRLIFYSYSSATCRSIYYEGRKRFSKSQAERVTEDKMSKEYRGVVLLVLFYGWVTTLVLFVASG